MASYSAAVAFGPLHPGRSEVRLTRRGRLIRTVTASALLLGMVAVGAERLTGEPARAVAGPAGPVITASVVVEHGDSLWVIAQRVAPASDPREVVHRMRELNGLRSNLIQPGQVLLVPSGR